MASLVSLKHHGFEFLRARVAQLESGPPAPTPVLPTLTPAHALCVFSTFPSPGVARAGDLAIDLYGCTVH